VFDLSLPKLLVLAVIALIVFGPRELPLLASKAGRALHDLRRIADGAQADLREGLGPEFSDFDLDDLHPRRFVQKHLLNDPNGDDLNHDDLNHDDLNGEDARTGASAAPGADARLPAGQRPPYDAEAT
jgi:sec-independent protein translocase protein TatB